MDLLEKSRETLAALGAKEAELVSGSLNPATFKPFGAPQGIYEQKDGLFMFRVRIPGGHLELAHLKAIAAVARRHDAKFVHFTTRQDLQLHGVKPGCFLKIWEELLAAGIISRGGGGNTFRNITASPLSGLVPDSVFDVAPLAKAVSDLLLGIDKLFSLPRKYKIAVSDSPADTAGAKWHDLGFVAVLGADGKPGFQVYGGGGLGRAPEPGIRLLDFIGAQDAFRAAVAMGDLFAGHGNREDRNAARIRFILKKLGPAAFKELFLSYYVKLEGESFPTLKALKEPKGLPKGAGRKPLKLSFKDGNVTAAELEKIATLAESEGQPFIRLAQDQSAWLPSIDSKKADAILEAFGLDASSQLRPLSCIGAKTCKIGVLDAQAAAQRVAEALAKLSAPLAAELAASIRISGCPNSCSAPQAATLGFHGLKRNIDGVSKGFFKVFAGSKDVAGAIVFGRSDDSWLVAEERIGDFIAFAAAEFSKAAGASTFKNWIDSNAEPLLAAWLKRQ